VRKIVAKTIGAAPVIAPSLKKIEGIDEADLYGSFASNQQDALARFLVIGRKALSQARVHCLGLRMGVSGSASFQNLEKLFVHSQATGYVFI
jgi:hypothetical protein